MAGQKEIDERLMTGLEFSREDLVTNKLGKLSEEQKQRLKDVFSNSADMGKKIAFVLWGVVLISVVALIMLGLPADLVRYGVKKIAREPQTFNWAALVILAVSFVVASLTSFFILVAKIGKRNFDGDLPVFSFTGTVEKSVLESWHTLSIGDLEFVYSSGDDAEFAAFEAGRNYCVYYVFNTSNIIVSAESN